MNPCKRSVRLLFPRVVLAGFLLLLAAALTGAPAYGQFARAVDVIHGDPNTTLQWSEGSWTLNNNPVPGCTTFTGGISTGPGGYQYADSVLCSPAPNGWHWTVTIPGPYTLNYDFYGFPAGVTVCGQIFGVLSNPDIVAEVYLDWDWMVCSDEHTRLVIWEGQYSTFDPEQAGFITFGAQRCGHYTMVPSGACCAPDGSCTVTTQAECAAPNIWQGEGTSCSPNPCPQPPPLGACCQPDGSCLVTIQADCLPPATWLGPDTVCEPNPCQQPVGACCRPDGSCLVTPQDQCLPPLVWMGPGTVCDPNPCLQPPGACCLPDGSCLLTVQADCPPPSVWLGPGTVCDPNPCQQPVGACCRPDGTCFISIQADCPPPDSWMGAGSDCSPNPCPQPTGACCQTDGTCTITTEANCPPPAAWLGPDTTCVPNPCPQPTGACCNLTTGECVLLTAAECDQQPYPHQYMGDGTVCDPNPCHITPIEKESWGSIKNRYR